MQGDCYQNIVVLMLNFFKTKMRKDSIFSGLFFVLTWPQCMGNTGLLYEARASVIWWEGLRSKRGATGVGCVFIFCHFVCFYACSRPLPTPTLIRTVESTVYGQH